MISYEFIRRGEGILTGWDLDRRQRRALERKLRFLEQVDRRLAEGSMVFKTKVADIWEVEIRGNVQLRPMVCFGPLDKLQELTFLARAVEKGNVIRPANARETAAGNLADLMMDVDRKRRRVWPPRETH